MAGVVASVLAAFFTSRLGVTGTLIGAALTSMVITLGSAILNASLDRAKTGISSLPTTVRGRLSTQRVRTSGSPDSDPNQVQNDEAFPENALRRRDRRNRRSPGLFGRLSAAPGNFGLLPTSARRRVLVAGSLAGLLTAVIALTTITGIETAIGQTLSCLGRNCPQQEATASGGAPQTGARTSLGSLVGTATGGGGTSGDSNPQGAPVGGEEPETPAGGEAPDAQPSAGGAQPIPQNETPASGEVPRDPAPPVTPTPEDPGQPGAETPATPGDGGVVTPPSGDEQPPTVEPSPTPPPIEEEPAIEPVPTPGGGEPATPDAGAAGQQPSDGGQ